MDKIKNLFFRNWYCIDINCSGFCVQIDDNVAIGCGTRRFYKAMHPNAAIAKAICGVINELSSMPISLDSLVIRVEEVSEVYPPEWRAKRGFTFYGEE